MTHSLLTEAAPSPIDLPTRRRACLALASGMLPAVLPTAARADVTDVAWRSAVDAVIRPLMRQQRISGMAVGVLADGRSSVFNYGLADAQTGRPVTDATRFEVGSVSKVFTATLAGYAAATGRLSLDDHPGRFVPAVKGRPIDQATLRHLGTYTAGGLPLQFPDSVAATDAAALAYLAAFATRSKPGAVRGYSNPSIGLLGHAVGQALKPGFAAAMTQQMLPALGLTQTHLRVPESAMADYAMGEREDGQAARVSDGPLADPAYGIKTTATDLLRLLQANLEPSALPAAWRQAVTATHAGQFRSGLMVQCLGWEQYPWPLSREMLLGGHCDEMSWQAQPAMPAGPALPGSGGMARLYDKTGATGGFGAYIAFITRPKVGLVMLANRSHPIPVRMEAAYAILKAIAANAA